MNVSGSSKETNKEFCGDCGVEHDKYEMTRRKGRAEMNWVRINPYYICFHCASKYQD